MEIRAYEQPWEDREPAGLRQLVLEKAKELCKYAEKVTLRVSSLTTKQWASYTVLGGLRLFLRSCERLRDLEIKVSLNGAMPAHCDVLEPLLELADNGLEIDIELIYTEEGLYVPLRDYERHIGRIARRAAGKQAQIWIEWTRVLSEDMKWTGFDWTLG
ncbi:hypothetical protein DH86_00001040 [Scytalidium sp. 3C]|nr:hypothetical protein DH86_00001040 [Scytalidium sp. 3C]